MIQKKSSKLQLFLTMSRLGWSLQEDYKTWHLSFYRMKSSVYVALHRICHSSSWTWPPMSLKFSTEVSSIPLLWSVPTWQGIGFAGWRFRTTVNNGAPFELSASWEAREQKSSKSPALFNKSSVWNLLNDTWRNPLKEDQLTFIPAVKSNGQWWVYHVKWQVSHSAGTN